MLYFFFLFRGCSYVGGLARFGGLVHLGEMIFIPRSYGIFYLSSIKKFIKKIVWLNKQWRKAIMQNECSYII